MEEHVEAADGPRGGIIDLTAKAEVGEIATALLHVFPADDEHTAGSNSGIVDAPPHSRYEGNEADSLSRPFASSRKGPNRGGGASGLLGVAATGPFAALRYPIRLNVSFHKRRKCRVLNPQGVQLSNGAPVRT